MKEMIWQQWVLLTHLLLGVLATTYMVGKERDPISPGTAVAAVVVGIGMAVVVMSI